MLDVDMHLHDTYFVVAHFHYVMMGGTVIAFVGGLHYWWPKMTGQHVQRDARPHRAACSSSSASTSRSSRSSSWASRGMPRRYYNYLDQFQPLHEFSTVGSLGPRRWASSWSLSTCIHSLQERREGAGATRGARRRSSGRRRRRRSPRTSDARPVVTRGPYDFRHARRSRDSEPAATQPHCTRADAAEELSPDFHVAHHFDSADTQFDAAKLGMWLFLVTEVLFFGGLFCAFAIFRDLVPRRASSRRTTTSTGRWARSTRSCCSPRSLTMALAVRAAQTSKQEACATMLLRHDRLRRHLPGGEVLRVHPQVPRRAAAGRRIFTARTGFDHRRRPRIFFAIYFMMTGVHGLHVSSAWA